MFGVVSHSLFEVKTVFRAWLGVALLAASWLLGLSYYHQAHTAGWAILVVAGTACLLGGQGRTPARAICAAAAGLLVPAVLVAPWPYKTAFLFMMLGSLLAALPVPRRWAGVLARSLLCSGVVLLGQSLAMLAYERCTAGSHELPGVLARMLCALVQLAGMDASLAGRDIAVHSMRQVHPLGATWELFLDPVTCCFLVGGICLLGILAWSELPAGERGRYLLRSAGRLVLCTAAWLPVRAVLLIALYVHRVLMVDYDAPLDVVRQFWSPWLHLGLLGVPLLLAWRFVARPPAIEPRPQPTAEPRRSPAWLSAGLAFAALAALTAGLVWNPVGQRQAGRVAVDEYHSSWEPTGRPYDTEWYGHDSGYNYACIYDYCSRFYQMSRISEPLSPAALREVDVLILKVPNLSAYGPSELDAIEQFVQRGGGLLLIAEHTDVFKTGTHINDVARRFGFRFRPDCLFGVDSVFEQLYRPPMPAHPIVQGLGTLDFAVSCSIDTGQSVGRAAILGTGLKNLGADYHASNFYPQAQDQPEMRAGAFVQLWTTKTNAGAGRVAAFGDSTQFSNFCVFDPGKSELFVGMVEWLNHRSWLDRIARPALLLVGLLALAGCVLTARKRDGHWLVLAAAASLGWAGSILATSAWQGHAMPGPRAARPMVRVVFDQTVCDVKLPKNGFIAGKEDEFGIFERWVLRLGYFTRRATGTDAFTGDILVFVCPDKPVSNEFRQQLEKYVSGGGKVLLIDSPGTRSSSANSLLYPFGLKLERSREASGSVSFSSGWPSVPVEAACEVVGGQAIARIGELPVGASVPHGAGSVTVLTFGSRFNDLNMGVTGDVTPDAALRQVYDVEFGLLRALANGAATQPASQP